MNKELRPVVFSIHGIRTRGEWQKESLGKALGEHGFTHIALDYGFFSALRLLLPWCRRKQIDWFRDKYTSHCPAGAPVPSVIAHSFGTYLVARSIQIYPEMVFDRVILCGSIVQREYPWSQMLKAGQCTAVLNDYGQMDWPAWIAEFGIGDAGPSGVDGFVDQGEGRVLQRRHPEFRHSDYFYELNYRKNWIPFLTGETPAELTSADRPKRNRRFLATVCVILIALGGLGWFGWSTLHEYFRPADYVITFPMFAAEFNHVRQEGLRLSEFRNDHVGERVVWEAIVIDVKPDTTHPAYSIGPAADTRFEDRVLARFDSADFDGSLPKGTKIRIAGVIEDINPVGTILTRCEILERLAPPSD